MLHIITPLYRYHLLEKVYQSIRKDNDITWHIAKSSQREKLGYDFIHTDPRIKVYELDCLDTDTVTKRNVIFNNVKNGFFYCLDDDTIFLEETYKVYKEYYDAGFEGMIVGRNNIVKNYKSLKLSSIPEETFLDSGMVICHSKVLKKQKWGWSKTTTRDSYFWSKCYQFYGKENTVFLDRVISHYNSLAPYVRIRKSLIFIDFKYDVYNLSFARNYMRLALAKKYFYYFVALKKNPTVTENINYLKSMLDALAK